MARRQLAVLVLSGYVAALLPVLWARYDIGRIPRSIWRYAAGSRPRELWRGALLLGYVLGGWPGLLVAIVWWVSPDRRGLREEWAHLHRRNVESQRRAAPGDPAAAAAAPEREIVLADYEDEPQSDPEPESEAVPKREDAPPAPG